MASIEKRIGDNGKPEYRARWRDAEGKSRRSKWYGRKYDAERQRSLMEADLHRGTYVDHSNTVTVAEYFRGWVAARPVRPRTKTFYEQMARNHVEPLPLGSRPLVKVRPSEVQAWATSLAGRLNPYVLRIRVGVLRSVFATALLDGLIAKNPVQPAKRLSLPPVESKRVVPLTVEQVRALAAEMPEPYGAMVVAHAGLGLRMGELLALRVADVNFLRREVRVEWQLDVVTLERVPPKTPKSRRTIPLPRVVAETLSEHIAAWPPDDDGTIFTRQRGEWRGGGRPRTKTPPGPIQHQRYTEWVRTAAERAGLPPTTTHDLRHHYASLLLLAGESVAVVAERLGHVDATMVLTTYGHVMPNQEDRTRRAIDAAWSDPAASERETGS